MSGWTRLDAFLRTDPRDVGCDETLRVLEIYAELTAADPAEARSRFPGVAAHVASCGPCAQDLAGLLELIRAEQDAADGADDGGLPAAPR
ncbi:hypothetical protein [Cellulomonas alba]|uniref:Zinc-finger domain-containing protein n=1 Tax=Cellulomonas alba TaxID=3053467 RepID=A0ABT7SCN6_9CELL|nr:hypothetical protein [Cellulomonas alba]MDM7853819.1 hypothetical protein [Cellulomonas alba]